MRAVDLLSPVGKGQRGLIVSPPKVGKTTILKQFCQAVAVANPEVKVYVLLVDERPEEVTEFRRAVSCEIFASCSDRHFGEHIRTAEQVYQRAVADAAAGKDALIVLDSLTRLSRAHNTATTGSRTLSGGLDSRAMEVPLSRLGRLDVGASGNLTLSSMCTVFAESEVVSLIAEGTETREIVAGLNRAIASRTQALVKRVAGDVGAKRVAMSGGVARNPGVVRALSAALGTEIAVPAEPDTVGALGAALIARERAVAG